MTTTATRKPGFPRSENSDSWAALSGAVERLASDDHFRRRSIEDVRVVLAPFAQDARQRKYVHELDADLARWSATGAPDFTRSRAAFAIPRDGAPWLFAFVLRCANGPEDRMRFDAAILRNDRAPWLDDVSRSIGADGRFAPAELLAATSGFGRHCAVLFPEHIAGDPIKRQAWAIFLCRREAERLARFVARASRVFPLPDELAEPNARAFQLWDLLHDEAHEIGPLPLSGRLADAPTLPLALSAIEELRVDLLALEMLERAPVSRPLRSVTQLVLLVDRSMRFACTNPGSYDALAGTALLGRLLGAGALRDGRIDLDVARRECRVLRVAIDRLYESVSFGTVPAGAAMVSAHAAALTRRRFGFEAAAMLTAWSEGTSRLLNELREATA